MKSNQPPVVALMIPLKNERLIAPILIDRLNIHFEHSILDFVFFIDDHSTDETYAFLLEKSENFDWIKIARNEFLESGYGSAVSFGINTMLDQNITWAVIADSDLTNSLEEIEKLAVACLSEKDPSQIGVIKGNRYWSSGTHMMGLPVSRKTLSIVANLISRVLSLNVHPDPTNGFRAINISRYPKFGAEVGFESIIQELYEVKLVNLEVGIFNTTLNYDQDIRGKSSFRFEISLIFRYISWLFKIGRLRIFRKSLK
jgi:glycosyltransferase involved in cell wall biosynthesis